MPINFNSKIISYILKHLEGEVSVQEVKELMEKIDIKCKTKDNRIIFNYTIGADFSNPVVQEARGIIMDMGAEDVSKISDWRVVCWPFRKFGNWGESYADDINWNTAQVQAKIDGSILKLYRYNGQWHWATNGCIDACDANTPLIGRTFQDVIESADNFGSINYDILDKYNTYIFELVSPETRVVVEYDKTHLYHLGTRSNLTGVEFNNFIGIEKPHIYNIADPNLEKVIEEAKHLNNGVCEHEGFVVCDSDYHRIKVKNPEYLMLHHSLTKDSVSKDDVVEAIILNDEEKIMALLSYPRLKVQFKYYDWQVTKFLYELEIYVNYVRNVYPSCGSRKEFALKIKDDKFKAFGFMAVDNPDMTVMQLIKKFGISKVGKGFIKNEQI